MAEKGLPGFAREQRRGLLGVADKGSNHAFLTCMRVSHFAGPAINCAVPVNHPRTRFQFFNPHRRVISMSPTPLARVTRQAYAARKAWFERQRQHHLVEQVPPVASRIFCKNLSQSFHICSWRSQDHFVSADVVFCERTSPHEYGSHEIHCKPLNCHHRTSFSSTAQSLLLPRRLRDDEAKGGQLVVKQLRGIGEID